MKKKTSGKKKFQEIKKSLKDFMADEDGFVKKENILKIGLGTITALGIMSSLVSTVNAHSSHVSHVNTSFLNYQQVPSTTCYKIAGNHNSHPSHASHSSY